MAPKVLVADKLSRLALDIFAKRGIDAHVKTDLTRDELIEIIPGYDGIAVRSATKVTEKVVAAADQLKVIGRAGIGVDNVDLKAATSRGIIVMNTPFGNSITTAEHAIALMLALARQVPLADLTTRAGKWAKSELIGVEITGKCLGIIGCGNIGAIVADRARGLKMKVVAFDPYLSPERATDLGVEKVELDALFRRADFITLAYAAHRQDAQDHQWRRHSHDARRRAHHQLCERRPDRRAGAFRGASNRQGRRRRDRRL